MKRVSSGTELQRKYQKHSKKNKIVKSIIKKLIKFGKIDSHKAYGVHLGSLADPIYDPWNYPRFKKTYSEINQTTLLSKESLYSLMKLAESCKSLPGMYIELGTYKGGSAKAISSIIDPSRLHCFDTFTGLKNISSFDSMEENEFNDTDIEIVEHYLPGVNIHQGIVPDTLSSIKNYGRIAFAHIDLDLYKPILESMDFIYNRMSIGGIIVFDDYGHYETRGAKFAVDTFLDDKEEKAIPLITGQAFIIKR